VFYDLLWLFFEEQEGVSVTLDEAIMVRHLVWDEMAVSHVR
jgi:hypothetical protein